MYTYVKVKLFIYLLIFTFNRKHSSPKTSASLKWRRMYLGHLKRTEHLPILDNNLYDFILLNYSMSN